MSSSQDRDQRRSQYSSYFPRHPRPDLPTALLRGKELWQTEWCPASRRVRERLTELGVDYLTHQVPVERDDRVTLRGATGTDTIPVLVIPDGSALAGEAAIISWLDRHFDEPPEGEAHRLKAAKARRRYLEEECECPPPVTH